jgi:Amt family ammonium transporter
MGTINGADTAFLIVSTAMVLFMTPALAYFYAGMVRRENTLSVTMQSFFAIGLVGVLWMLAGFTLAFGGDVGGLIGGLSRLGLTGVNAASIGAEGHRVPLSVFAMYQGMFAIVAAALISGSIVERMKFKAYAIFIGAWSLLVYAPLAHWVWGGGWLQKLGALDFAGGMVVHISAAAAGLAGCIVVGARRRFRSEPMHPHNLPMTIFGCGALFFGWVGFNAGSALAADGLAGSAALATIVGGAGGILSWTLLEWKLRGAPTTLGAASGAIAGLGTITAASGFVEPAPALLIGVVAGVVCYFAIQLKDRLGFDDSLDVVGTHGIGGTIGTLLTGVFAGVATNATATGLFTGNPGRLGVQVLGVVVAWLFSFGVSFLILKVIDATVGLRVDAETETIGLDIAEHAETAYEL